MHFLILRVVLVLPVFDDLLRQFLSCSAVDGVHCHGALKLLELLLDLRALGLLLVKFVLEFTSHTIVSILSLFEIVTNLMDVGEGVEVFVLVQHLV